MRHAPGKDPLIADDRATFELYDLRPTRPSSATSSALHPDVAARLQKRMRACHAPPPYRRMAYRPRRTGREFRLGA